MSGAGAGGGRGGASLEVEDEVTKLSSIAADGLLFWGKCCATTAIGAFKRSQRATRGDVSPFTFLLHHGARAMAARRERSPPNRGKKPQLGRWAK
eukprot:scaffold811_cov84-Isochrysis_galbana.AAC.3